MARKPKRLHQQSPLEVVGTFEGPGFNVDITEGHITGDWLEATANSPDWLMEVDGQGNVTRTYVADESGVVPLTCSGSSPLNDELSKLRRKDRESMTIVGVLKLKDLRGTTRIDGINAFIEGKPSKRFSTTGPGQITWRFLCAELDMFIGGAETA